MVAAPLLIQRDAEQIAESADHPVGVLGVAVNERGNRVKGIEQKMRMEFGLQRLESCLHQSCLELSLSQLLALVTRDNRRPRSWRRR